MGRVLTLEIRASMHVNTASLITRLDDSSGHSKIEQPGIQDDLIDGVH